MVSCWFGSVGYRDSYWNEAQSTMQNSVVWDDFNRFLETITGKETLHVAAGITYQTITEEESIDQEPDDDGNLSSEEESCFT